MLEFAVYDENLLNLFPDPFCLRGPDEQYITCNKAFANFANLTSPKDIVGMNDTQFHWDKYIEIYLESDKIARENKNSRIIEPIISADKKEVTVLTKKTAIELQDYSQVVACHISIIENSNFHTLKSLMKKNTDIKINSVVVDNYSAFLGKKITEKESEIYFYMLRGFSSKQIAQQIKRSPKTVESHIEKLKEKLNCKTRSDLINIAYENNILNIMPPELWNACF